MGVRPDSERSQHRRWWRRNQLTSLKTGDSDRRRTRIPPNAYAGLPLPSPLKGSDASDRRPGPRAETSPSTTPASASNTSATPALPNSGRSRSPHRTRTNICRRLKPPRSSVCSRRSKLPASARRMAPTDPARATGPPYPSNASRSCRTCASVSGASNPSVEHAGSAPAFRSSYALASTRGDPVVTHQVSAVDNPPNSTPAELAVLRASLHEDRQFRLQHLQDIAPSAADVVDTHRLLRQRGAQRGPS